MIKFSNILLLSSAFLYSCGVAEHTPITTIKDQTESLHKTIEDTTKALHVTENYQSLAFGQLKVFKPAAFVRLDSIYKVKQGYLDKNNLRGLHRSGIEESIPAYRAEAQQEIHEVQYELEHIYQTLIKDTIRIHHSYYLFDYKDSLLFITPLYDFQILDKHKDLFYAYQFDYHFVTNRELYISKAEWEFIQFFKNKEVQLIGEENLQRFMNHTMHIMDVAKRASTTDYRSISKLIVIDRFRQFPEKITVEKFGHLIALEKNETVIAYEFNVEWINEISNIKQSTTFTFSPYLEITAMNTQPL